MPPYAPDRQTSHRTTGSPPRPRQLKRNLLNFIPERFVRFEECVLIFPYPKLTNEEKVHVWYTTQEISQHKEDNRNAIRHHRHGANPPRGLEHRTGEGLQRVLRNRLSGLATVLRMQNYARNDHDRIAQAYWNVTRHCQLEACDVAIGDQMEATMFEDGDEAKTKQNFYEDNNEIPEECLSCFSLSPRWLVTLLSPAKKDEVILPHPEHTFYY